jgi:phospholipase/lecithinase/hemolysin
MNNSRRMIFGLVFLLILPASMPAFGWDTIISFGDSLSDDGNGGYNNFPAIFNPGDTGPASDGPVWLDYLAESMKNVQLEGRAIGGAQTSGPVYEFGDIGMQAQVDRYIFSLGAGEPPEGGYDLSGILFTVWIGGNDFLANPNPTDPHAVIEPAIYRIEASIQDLVDAGAEDILIMTLPDLGLAPYILNLDLLFKVNGSLIAAYTDASEQFNESLATIVCILRKVNADKNIKFYMADTFKLLQYAVENGEALGFENVNIPCTWPGGMSCGVSTLACSSRHQRRAVSYGNRLENTLQDPPKIHSEPRR